MEFRIVELPDRQAAVVYAKTPMWKMPMIKGMHRGPYRKVGATYDALLGWAQSQKLRLQPVAIEQYLNDPRSTPQDKLETLVFVPLQD